METLNLEKQLDLRKDIVLNLVKQQGLNGQKAQVVSLLDYSGSMSDRYTSGSVQRTVERLLPLGLVFDDNDAIDFYLFTNKVYRIGEVKRNNLVGCVNNAIRGKNMSTTDYAGAIDQIVRDYGKTEGFFSKTPAKMDLPVYVIFITDGKPDSRSDAERALRNASNHGIFFQFIGIGNDDFSFLEKLDSLSGRKIDNANYFHVRNLDQESDETLYNKMLTEFPDWITKARQLGMIR